MLWLNGILLDFGWEEQASNVCRRDIKPNGVTSPGIYRAFENNFLCLHWVTFPNNNKTQSFIYSVLNWNLIDRSYPFSGWTKWLIVLNTSRSIKLMEQKLRTYKGSLQS